MARDPRKNSAFDSGMRGREKPKVAESHGRTQGSEEGSSKGGEHKQGASTVVGDPDGVDLIDSAYSSGMRGMEKAKQKKASGNANKFAEEGSKKGGESKQGPDTIVGGPQGEQSWSGEDRGPKKGINDEHLRSATSNAYQPGASGSSNALSLAASNSAPEGEAGILGEEDETHINIRIPKSSLKKKVSGLHIA